VGTVTCPACGDDFEARSPRATYCSPRCRQRASRAGARVRKPAKPAKVASLPPPATDTPEVPSVTGAAIAELAEANALHSAAGLAAVRLAQLVDSATLMSASAPAAWVREMRAALAEAKQAAPATESDPIDDLERKRAARRGA